MASKGSEVIKSIHALATLRHLDADPSQIGVIVKPLRPPAPSATGGELLAADEELAERCHWEAQVRLGGGRWCCFVGTGETPGRALLSLLKSYEEAHEAVDKRRAGVLERRKVALAGCERTCVVAKGSGATLPEKGFAEFVVPRHMLLDGPEPTPAQRLHLADELLTELMEQAQHHDSGGQTWEMLAAKRAELGLSAFVLSNERAPTK